MQGFSGKQKGISISLKAVVILSAVIGTLLSYLLLADVIVKKSGKVGKENGGK